MLELARACLVGISLHGVPKAKEDVPETIFRVAFTNPVAHANQRRINALGGGLDVAVLGTYVLA